MSGACLSPYQAPWNRSTCCESAIFLIVANAGGWMVICLLPTCPSWSKSRSQQLSLALITSLCSGLYRVSAYMYLTLHTSACQLAHVHAGWYACMHLCRVRENCSRWWCHSWWHCNVLCNSCLSRATASVWIKSLPCLSPYLICDSRRIKPRETQFCTFSFCGVSRNFLKTCL